MHRLAQDFTSRSAQRRSPSRAVCSVAGQRHLACAFRRSAVLRQRSAEPTPPTTLAWKMLTVPLPRRRPTTVRKELGSAMDFSRCPPAFCMLHPAFNRFSSFSSTFCVKELSRIPNCSIATVVSFLKQSFMHVYTAVSLFRQWLSFLQQSSVVTAVSQYFDCPLPVSVLQSFSLFTAVSEFLFHYSL